MPAMLSADSLQPPKMGSSRWSKALPEVPGIDFGDIYDEYEDEPSPVSAQNKNLPRLPIVPPPPRSTSMANAKLLPSSLPPLHLLNTSVGYASGPPNMSIPRRPVGQPSRLPQQHQQLPAQPPSPTQSISSILSAYSRSSGESLVQGSDAATSSIPQIEVKSSLSHQAPPASTKPETLISPSTQLTSNSQLPPTQHHHVAPKPNLTFESNRPPPPPPTKDPKYGLPASPAATRSQAPAVDTSSPPRPQIWRRRSIKTDRSLELPDLKLVISHGSTAATHPVAQQVEKPAGEPVAKSVEKPVVQPVVQPVTEQHLPQGAVKVPAFAYQQPQSDNKPQVVPNQAAQNAWAPSPKLAAENENQTMGSGSSKLNRLKDKLHTLHRRGKSSLDTASEPSLRPGAQRPPTPEYQKQDVKTPIVDAFISPLSPASSPEPLADTSPVLPKELPSIPPQEPAQVVSPIASLPSPEAKLVARKALPPPVQQPTETKPLPELTAVSELAPPSQGNDVAKPLPTPKLEVVAESESPVTGSLPSFAAEDIRFPSSAGTSPASRTNYPVDIPTKFPPRGSSVRSNAPKTLEQSRQPAAELDVRPIPAEPQGFLYKGRDGTLYPEMKVTRDADPQAAYFPTQAYKEIAADQIFKAIPLKDSHFGCYQGHRTMNRRNNRNYPLTCQTCEKPDVEDRWTCTFCHLRICESCFTTLNGKQRDLRHMVENMRHTIST
ncbi:hypothetical protein EDB81DRAFT_166744 [Dactylonectria macrodidyma]|uniref:Uncharacterized protein n=1 Tax=Dactylonectria macrodidyma TaxID=307937 RepID=A0A9P9JL44_9HYPO|nr:hypothetical protein EDB81DRAFT_166744 [Dactylonectria macrodidyma]